MVSAVFAANVIVTTKIRKGETITYPLFDSVIFIIEYNKFVKMLSKDS